MAQGTVSKLEAGRPVHNATKVRDALRRLGDDAARHAPHLGETVVPGRAPVADRGVPNEDDSEEPRWLLAHAAHITVGIVDGDFEAPEGPDTASIPGRVEDADVEHLEAMTEIVRAADYRYGGGVAMDAIAAYLERARRYTQAEGDPDVSHRLRVALADLYNLAGWSAFDTGAHGSARRYFAHALVEAKRSGAPSLSANILYRTGRLYLHQGSYQDALRFFQLGQLEAQNSSCTLTVSLLCANEAWALALLDDENGALQSLQRAQDEFTRADPTHAPSWVRFFCEADIYAMTGVASVSLTTQTPRSQARATENLLRGLHMRDADMERSKAFEQSALATAHLAQGDIDEGVAVGHQAADVAGRLRSRRVTQRLAPVERAARAARSRGEPAELADRIATLHLA
ncbi:helix-turn-helix transcriptional regulator [Streptomonospora salina]